MKNSNTLKSLRTTLILGAVWDSIGGIIFLVIHGLLQKELTPSIYPFYSMVLGIFLFTLVYLQILTTSNIIKLLQNMGVIIAFRISFGCFLIFHSLLFEPLPAQFFAIAFIDFLLSISQIIIVSRRKDLIVKNLFIPEKI
jgi:uncharacterized YccA/Bax inhibitor family protein